MIKNNDRWDENDVRGIAEYCISSGVSSSMTKEGRDAFNSWAKSAFKSYPKEGTVLKFFSI